MFRQFCIKRDVAYIYGIIKTPTFWYLHFSNAFSNLNAFVKVFLIVFIGWEHSALCMHFEVLYILIVGRF